MLMFPLVSTEPIPTDFWGIVLPTWIAAVGGIVGAVVAVVALVISLAAKGRAKDAIETGATNREAVETVALAERDSIESRIRAQPRAATLNTEDIDVAVMHKARLDAMLRHLERAKRG